MTHKRLLDKLAYTPHTDPNGKYMYRALRAIVELHKPVKYKTVLHVRTGCACGAAKYPCPTIQAIEAAFND